MLKFFKDILSAEETVIDEPVKKEKSTGISKLQIATCALFLEVANADDEFLDAEKAKIIQVMKKIFNLDTKSVKQLMKLSEERRLDSISLYEYSGIINEKFSKAEKYEILKFLWRLIFVDDKLDSYEAQIMRKISGNLKMNHSDMIAAKMEVKKELEGENHYSN